MVVLLKDAYSVRSKSIYAESISSINIIKGFEIYLYFLSNVYIKNASIENACVKNACVKDNCIKNINVENVFIKNPSTKDICGISAIKNLKMYF